MRVDLDDPKLEIKLKVRDMKLKIWDAVIKGVTAFIVILTAIIGVSSYLSQRNELIRQNARYEEQRAKERAEAIEQQRRDAEQRAREFNSIIYRTRLELYLEATDALSRFAYASNLDEAEKADQRFWELYDGRLSIVEDQEVKDKMVFCGDFLEKWETCKKIPPPDLFQDLAYDLTQACRRSLMTVFPRELNPLTQGQSPRQYIESQRINDVCKK